MGLAAEVQVTVHMHREVTGDFYIAFNPRCLQKITDEALYLNTQ